jgi:hypothetical protein
MTKISLPVAIIAIGATAWGCRGTVDMGKVDGSSDGQHQNLGTDSGRSGDDMLDGTVPEDATNPIAQNDGGSPGNEDAEFEYDVVDQICSTRPVDASACWAGCCTAAGTVASFASAADVYAAVAGRWLFCTGLNYWQGFGAPTDALGVEFTPGTVGDACGPNGGIGCGGGNMYYLVEGPGGLTRGAGFAYQLTYDVAWEGGGDFAFNMHPSANSGASASIRYSSCPTEIEITSTSQGPNGVLVPVY